MVFPVTLYGSKSWTLKKQERKILVPLEFGAGEESREDPGQSKIQIDGSLTNEAGMAKLKLSFLGHIMQNPSSLFLKKALMPRRVAGKRKRA